MFLEALARTGHLAIVCEGLAQLELYKPVPFEVLCGYIF